VASNLGADAVIAFHCIRLPAARARLRWTTAAAADFLAARAEVNRREAPAIKQRSMVRYFSRNIDRLREGWFGPDPS
jgi:hypothetical protein